jgi:large conductance mechanosensitive channel
MRIVAEFKEFAIKGNVMDMAVGLVIGSEFNKIVNSVVADIILPPVGMLINNVDFKDLFIDLSRSGAKSLAEAKTLGAATLNYGNFITTAINFIIMAFSVFLVVKALNRLRGDEPAHESAPAPKA